MNAPFAGLVFEPTTAAALARLDAVRPAAYAATRNHLDGAVTQLSPYLTHGFLTLHQVLGSVNAREPLEIQHKLIYELGWREYFRHVWRHLGSGILESLQEGPLPDHAYSKELPADIREARTGVPVIDRTVSDLYATGYLHNHARMWLASYVVHLRRVHWRAGADWLYGHLLDGDLASNHLSWQWVAGTGSHKPYLFNAENVARFAPSAYRSEGCAIDASYEALERVARGAALPAAGGACLPPTPEPTLTARAPDVARMPPPGAEMFADRDLWLVHPWSLAEPPTALPAGGLRVGLWLDEFHRDWPWSAARWRFVGARMEALTDLQCRGDAQAWRAALRAARRVHGWSDPHLGAALDGLGLDAAPRVFPDPASHCRSFSKFWTQATRGLRWASDLL